MKAKKKSRHLTYLCKVLFTVFMCYNSDFKDKVPDVSTPIHTEEMDHIFNQFNGKHSETKQHSKMES